MTLQARLGSLLAAARSASSDPWRLLSARVFGASAIALYVVSTCHHALVHTRARHALRVCDHALIHVLIAGTYTPFTLVHLRGGLGWWLFGAL